MKKKLIVMFLCISIFALSIPAVAGATEIGTDSNETIMKPMFVNILSFSNSFNIDGAGVASIYTSVYYTDASSCIVLCALQKWTGSYWTYVDSWSTSEPANGSLSWAYVSGTKSLSRGQYRISSSANIYNSYGTLVDSASYISPSQTY